MKTILLATVAALTLIPSAFGAEVLKTCSTELGIPGEGPAIPTSITIYRNGEKVIATMSQTISGMPVNAEIDITISEHSVRAGITEGTQPEDLSNTAEALILHAQMLATDPVFEGKMSAGFDLSKVRSATIYQLGESTNMGMAAILEGRDENGKVLGSFMGGFIVSACK